MALPPIHSLDRPIEYICDSDSAWDDERIEKEFSVIRNDPKENINKHPVRVYFSGTTRYDLDADGVREYVDFDKKPVVFRLRRLSDNAWTEIRNMHGAGKIASAQALAFEYGVVSIDNVDFTLEAPQTKHKTLTAQDLKLLRGAFGRSVCDEVGQAVINANQDLTYPE